MKRQCNYTTGLQSGAWKDVHVSCCLKVQARQKKNVFVGKCCIPLSLCLYPDVSLFPSEDCSQYPLLTIYYVVFLLHAALLCYFSREDSKKQNHYASFLFSFFFYNIIWILLTEKTIVAKYNMSKELSLKTRKYFPNTNDKLYYVSWALRI